MISFLRRDGGDHIFRVSSCKKLGLARGHEDNNLRYHRKSYLMVEILYQDPHSNSDSDYYNIRIPKNWSGGKDNEVTVIIDDVCVVVPQTIAGATGELIVLRTLEAMMAGDIIDAGDIQKAIEHIL